MIKRNIYLQPISNNLAHCGIMLHVLSLQTNTPLNKGSNAFKLHALLKRSVNEN